MLLNDVSSLRESLVQQKLAAEDVFTNAKRETIDNQLLVKKLEKRVTELEALCQQRNERIRYLEAEQEKTQAKLAHSANLANDKAALEMTIQRQVGIISKQSKDLVEGTHFLEKMKQALDEALLKNEELGLKVSGKTDLTVIFGEPWLLSRSRHRLLGELPSFSEENSLTSLGGDLLLMHSGACEGESSSPLAVLKLSTLTWELLAHEGDGRTGQSSVALSSSKLVMFGGRCRQNVTNDLRLFCSDSMRWISPSIRGSCPCRELHAACGVRNKMYVMGGVLGNGSLRSDISCLDFETMTWSEVPSFGQISPTPRRGHAMCYNETRKQIIIFGGFDGHCYLNDVYCFEIEKLVWLKPSVAGEVPLPRTGHAISMLGRFLFIAGGTDGRQQLADVYALDTELLVWERVIDWSNETGLRGEICGKKGFSTFLKSCSRNFAFHNNHLLMLKPGVDGLPAELEIAQFTSPDAIQAMWRTQSDREQDVASKLEILDDVIAMANSLVISWRPPGKAAERVRKYKVMMMTRTGVVKEVAVSSRKDVERVNQAIVKVTGLNPNVEYAFCVKAMYVDGTHEWSESKAFRTSSQ